MDELARVASVSLGEALDPRSPHATEVAHDLGQALDMSGAVYITDHGVAEDLLVQQFAAAQALFELPAPQRSRLVRSIVAPPDWHDAHDATWDCFECCSGKALSRGQGPAAVQMRGDVPAWLAQSTAHYVAAMSRLSARLLQLLAMSLDEPADTFHRDGTAALGVVRMLMYRSQGQGTRGPGAQAHTDRSALTVLAQDSHPGLEIEAGDGSWSAVMPRAGALLLHPGDALQSSSAGRYRSPRHRVRRGSGHGPRLSLPFFYTPIGGDPTD
jgi:isopenicillin N synthase-like dioxygenase